MTVPLIAAVAAAFVFAAARLLAKRASVNACNVGATFMLLTLNGLVRGL